MLPKGVKGQHQSLDMFTFLPYHVLFKQEYCQVSQLKAGRLNRKTSWTICHKTIFFVKMYILCTLALKTNCNILLYQL